MKQRKRLLAAAEEFRVRDVFQDRVPQEEIHVEPKELHIKKGQLRELLQHVMLRARQNGICNHSENGYVFHANVRYEEEKPRRISLGIFDVSGRNVDAHGETEICEFSLERKHGHWDFDHRHVDKRYRGNGMFSQCLRVLEETTAKFAGDLGREHATLVANIGQPMVLRKFLEEGFRPARRKFVKRIWDVLNGAAELKCDWAYDDIDGQWVQDTFNSLYCFSTDITEPAQMTRQKALRILLKKKVPAQ